MKNVIEKHFFHVKFYFIITWLNFVINLNTDFKCYIHYLKIISITDHAQRKYSSEFFIYVTILCVFISYFYLKDKICTGYFKQKQTLKIYIYEKGFI